MKNLLLTSVVSICGIAASNATLIANGDFETSPSGFTTDPGTGTPDWLWDGNRDAPGTADTDSISGFYAVSRASTANSWGGAIFQTTGESIALDTTYSMTVDAFNTWNPHGGVLVAKLYYLEGETRTYIPGAEDSYGGSENSEYATPGSMQIDYTGAGDAVGKPLGVEFEWAGASGDAGSPDHNGSWQAVDNVAIDIVPEPSSAVLLGLGGLALMRRRR